MKIVYGFPTTGKTEAQRFNNHTIDSDDFWTGDNFDYDKFFNAIKIALKEDEGLVVYTNLWDLLLDLEHMFRASVASITGFVRKDIKDVLYLFEHVRKEKPEDIIGNPNFDKGWPGIESIYSKYLAEAKVGLSDVASRIDINVIELADKSTFISDYLEEI